MMMAPKLMFIYKMKRNLILLLLPIISLASCANKNPISREYFYFDTYVEARLYEGEQTNLNELGNLFSKIDKLTDNFNNRDLDNIYKINNSNENVVVESELYEVLSLAFSSDLDTINMFNPLCGSLSKAWKNALANNLVLDNATISSELLKMQNTHLEFVSENTVKKVGDAEIDLGAVAKGYALDKAKAYLDSKEIKEYLIDAGSSSILVGEKDTGKNFKIKISNLENSYIEVKNCFISTSSSLRQKVVIDNKTYSHIINPVTGSAINAHDAVIIISDSGYLGDILSTDFVNESLDSIATLEAHFNVKTIVIDAGQISYKSEGIEVLNK